MKHVIKLFAFLILINFNLKSQPGWILFDTDIDQSIKEIKFHNESTGFAISFKKIYKTTNGGSNWQIKFTASENIYLNSIFVIDDKTIRVSGRQNIHIYDFARIYLSNNGGDSWEQVNFGGNSSGENIYFINSLTGYLASGFSEAGVITNGTIFKTINGGNNWFSISNDSTSNQYTYYNKVFFLNEETGWVGGFYAPDAGDGAFRVLKTTDGGINWFYQINQINNTNLNFGDMVFFNDGVGYITKYIYPDNLVLKTTDFGDSWIEIEFNANRFKFLNKDTGWFTIPDKKIYRTTNGANTWEHQFSNSYFLPAIDFINAQTGYVFGVEIPANYKIFKTTTGGVTSIKSVSNVVPSEFLLEQNFPNPFNPVTNIKFSIPKSSFVTLKVFDITGREVATLVNESLTAGEYNYQFSPTMSGQAMVSYQLSSGVYFYQLRAGEFMESKRFVLLK